MSNIRTYTTDGLGFVPRLWQIWEDPIYGKMRCIRVEKSGKSRATITVELLPQAWKIR